MNSTDLQHHMAIDRIDCVVKEQACLDYVLSHSKKNDPDSVLKAMDEFGYKNWMMAVGDVKGRIVDAQIQKYKPLVMVEIGGYCGYSTVRFASLQQQIHPNAKYHSFEFSKQYAEIASQIVAHAGLSEFISIHVGPFDQTFQKANVGQVDMFFIDHAKELYLPDLKLILQSSSLVKGSVIIADNILYPGAPDYKEFMTNSGQFRSEVHKTHLEYTRDIEDEVMVSEFLG